MSTFSANLRAEMARQGLAQYENALTDALSSRLHLDPERLWDIFCATSEDPIPTPAEITAIANALGVPESRLTVSREELEADVERLRVRVRELEEEFLCSGCGEPEEFCQCDECPACGERYDQCWWDDEDACETCVVDFEWGGYGTADQCEECGEDEPCPCDLEADQRQLKLTGEGSHG